MEQATIAAQDAGLVVFGSQLGVAPRPYSVRYELRLNPDGVAERFIAHSRTLTAERKPTMDRYGHGSWTVGTESLSIGPDEEPQDDPGPMEGALDIDLAYSPLFNSTPVLRDGLHLDGAEPRDYLMAWVSVPDLTVSSSRQRYEPMGRRGDLRIVRYTSLDSGFTAEIGFDDDGFVVTYEGFLERIAAERRDAP
jgi:hypothetical protein